MKIENWKEIGFATINFNEHLRNQLFYPKIEPGDDRFKVVPIDLTIGADSEIIKIELSKTPTALSNKYQYTLHPKFVDEAIKAIASFDKWVPNKINGDYQQTRKYLNISFFYHESILVDSDIYLNPDTRVSYPNKTDKYQLIVEGRHGCDGLGTILTIIDELGNPNDIRCLESHGKTNCEIVISEFLKLGKWKPAIQDGKSVKSQLSLTIYT